VPPNGDNDTLLRTWKVSPRKMSMPPRVTMKPGIPTKATQKPCQIPTSTPTRSAASTPTHQGICHLITTTAATAPVSATTEPTDRSIWAATITSSMPIARIRM
jgi:hypothetical protein